MPGDTPSPAVQDYLKAVYYAEEDSGRLWVSTSQIADALGVSAPSSSAMLKRLATLGYLVSGERRGTFALSDSGRSAALEVIRLHRLLETYLVRHLGVPVSEVHREAEVLEHHISEALGARIADVLGHPDRDPHGAPIPSLDGVVEEVPATSLADLGAGQAAVVHRIGDRDPSLFRALEQCGIVPDVHVRVLDVDDEGSVRVSVDEGEPARVPAAAARVVRVSPAG